MTDTELRLTVLARKVDLLQSRVDSLERRTADLFVIVGTLTGLFVLDAVFRSLNWPRAGFEYLCYGAVALYVLARWVRGLTGRGQWPEPYGRYYNRWLRLGPGAGDYYQWLARQKGNREPWRTWAERDRDAE